ncbi:SPS1 Serine threonine protein kinase [Pyrenophora tritici-repentis]|nr:SPS1 Serine threonine protein kinase [Pyrenophora tritici-repentis]KAI1561225.1 SPS1 Serine threonine protein kinase [Pyrenophora tritici-repentis]KAI1594676.1 SPS1 Serine threonine protein kinase [Pyrenophora tritici-repentis]
MRFKKDLLKTASSLASIDVDYASLEYLAVGGSGTIYAINSARILKEFDDAGIHMERRVSQRLGSDHVNIVRCLGQTRDGKGLVYERGRSVREVLRGGNGSDGGDSGIPLETRAAWLIEAAEGTQYMHDQGIIHADTGCHNWIIVGEHLKIIDFEGSSLDGGDAAASYEWFSYKESSPRISVKTDIFAFGCAVYEVVAGKQPYDKLIVFEDRMLRAKKLYAEGQFPHVEGLPLGGLMLAFWKACFDSMQQVVRELQVAGVADTSDVDYDYGDVGISRLRNNQSDRHD